MSSFARTAIPAAAGIGFRIPHTRAFLDEWPAVPWLEVHAETFLAEGGLRLAILEELRNRYPLSIHGVGLSLGSAEGIDAAHLERVAALVERFEPGLVSEHVAWSVDGGVYFNDLLPLPYTEEALEILCANVDTVQDRLRRPILVENPSTYMAFNTSTMPEWQFMAEIARRTGCGILLDVNNIHVSAHNQAFNPGPYLDAIPLDRVQEIHLAGHTVKQVADASLLIDDHGDRVADPVWLLFDSALERLGPVPTLVEWDTNLPALPVLLAEAAKAQTRLTAVAARMSADAA